MSFINDIQTVQELQDEESKLTYFSNVNPALTHNDTVIRNISPQPLDCEIKIEENSSSSQSEQESIIVNPEADHHSSLEHTLSQAVSESPF